MVLDIREIEILSYVSIKYVGDFELCVKGCGFCFLVIRDLLKFLFRRNYSRYLGCVWMNNSNYILRSLIWYYE